MGTSRPSFSERPLSCTKSAVMLVCGLAASDIDAHDLNVAKTRTRNEAQYRIIALFLLGFTISFLRQRLRLTTRESVLLEASG